MAGVIFEILVVAALAVPADSLKLEDWLKPGTEVRSAGVRASTSLQCQELAVKLNARPLKPEHLGYFCVVSL